MSTQHTTPDQWHIQQVHDHVTALTAERDRLLEELAQVYETRDRAGIQLANANERLRAVNAELVAALKDMVTANTQHSGLRVGDALVRARDADEVHEGHYKTALAALKKAGR